MPHLQSLDPHLSRDSSRVIETLGEKNSRFSGKTVLLTGATGFLGTQFVHYFLNLNQSGLLKQPCRLLAWDNFSRGIPDWLAGLQELPDFRVEKRDVIERAPFEHADFLIHAASIASPSYYRLHPIETMDANVQGLRNLLDDAVVRPVESFLYFSTSEIYGDPDPANIPTAETYRGNVSCTGPRACYDESKRYGETLSVNFFQQHKVPVKTARPFNNYGPGLKITDKRVIPDFFRDILAGRNITLLSKGNATRTFCYVSDAITGYLLILLSDHSGEAFNIGTVEPEISMTDLAQLAIDVSGKDLSIEFKNSADPEYLTDNPQRRCPTIAKAQKLLGYSPKISLREGLRNTYEYYLDHSDAVEG